MSAIECRTRHSHIWTSFGILEKKLVPVTRICVQGIRLVAEGYYFVCASYFWITTKCQLVISQHRPSFRCGITAQANNNTITDGASSSHQPRRSRPTFASILLPWVFQNAYRRKHVGRHTHAHHNAEANAILGILSTQLIYREIENTTRRKKKKLSYNPECSFGRMSYNG